MSTLHHVIDLEWMQKAYRLTRKDGAPGIDGVTADDYATNLDANLLEPIREVSIHDEELATRRLSMMRIMARWMKAATVLA